MKKMKWRQVISKCYTKIPSGQNVINGDCILLQDNDYIDSYFDNGEDFAAGSDDNMDGEATY